MSEQGDWQEFWRNVWGAYPVDAAASKNDAARRQAMARQRLLYMASYQAVAISETLSEAAEAIEDLNNLTAESYAARHLAGDWGEGNERCYMAAGEHLQRRLERAIQRELDSALLECSPPAFLRIVGGDQP